MKKAFVLLSVLIVVLCFGSVVTAQTATDKQVAISWDAGTEPDIQSYQLYVSSTGDDADYGPAGDPIMYNPNEPDAPTTLSTNYTFVAPAGEVTTRWFKVTAIDTSGNESAPSEAVSVTVDNQPPGPPQNVRVEVIIPVVQ